MSIRRNVSYAILAVGAIALSAATPPAVAAIPTTAASVIVKETARVRGAGATTRASSRIRLTAAVASDVKPTSLSVTIGGFHLDLTLKHGRYSGQINTGTGPVIAEVTTRGHRLDATLRARLRDGGAVFGDTVVADAATDGVASGMAYDLEEATLSIDGVATQIALGLAARIDSSPGADGDLRTRARVTGAAIAPAAPPVVQIPRPDDPWTGRVAGHALAVGSVPRLTASLSGGLPFVVNPVDAAARNYGSGTVDSPGVRTLTIGTDTYYQARFDTAVQSVAGPQTLVVGVPDGAVYATKQKVEFVAPATDAPIALSAHTHVLEVRGDQTLWAWGDNAFGQVGDGTKVDPAAPIRLPTPPQVRAVAAGGNVSLALDLGGGVWLWGEWNATHTQAGGTDVTREIGEPVPTAFADLPTGVIAIAAGEDHALALDFDGEVWAFGENYAGQLGDGTFDDHARHPQHVLHVPPVVAIAAGGTTSLALDKDGVVWAWGQQTLAGIGDGTLPVAVAGLPKIIGISAGGSHALALAEDGTVWSWGANADGELGNGTQTPSDVPVQVTGLLNVSSISAGTSHSLALLVDGTVWAWGANGAGELGDGTSAASSVPVQVRDLAGMTHVSAGDGVSFAVDATDALWVWGAYRFVRGSVGASGVYPRLAARGDIEGRIPESPSPLPLAKR